MNNAGVVQKNRIVKIENKEYSIKEKEYESLFRIGKFFSETKREKNMFCDSDSDLYDGVYIYQDNIDPNIGYRIYKEFAQYQFDGYFDDKLVARLTEKQKCIKKSKFPIGIITVNEKIMGQEIPLFPNSTSLFSYSNESPKDLIIRYAQVVNILKELCDNGIYYLDGHCKNFLIDKSTNNLEIIDFEWSQMEFDVITNAGKYKIFANLNKLIEICNKNSKFDTILNRPSIESFEQANEYLKESQNKLFKSIKYCR